MLQKKIATPQNFHELSLLRLHQIIGSASKGITPLIPVSRSVFYAGIKSGIYPKSVKLGARNVAWRYSDLKDCIQNLQGGAL